MKQPSIRFMQAQRCLLKSRRSRVMAYQCVQLLRRQFKESGIHKSWSSLRQTLSTQGL